jgi:hypothetical protein
VNVHRVVALIPLLAGALALPGNAAQAVPSPSVSGTASGNIHYTAVPSLAPFTLLVTLAETSPTYDTSRATEQFSAGLDHLLTFGTSSGNLVAEESSLVSLDGVIGGFELCASSGGSADSPKGGYTMTSEDIPFVATIMVLKLTAICAPPPPSTLRTYVVHLTLVDDSIGLLGDVPLVPNGTFTQSVAS